VDGISAGTRRAMRERGTDRMLDALLGSFAPERWYGYKYYSFHMYGASSPGVQLRGCVGAFLDALRGRPGMSANLFMSDEIPPEIADADPKTIMGMSFEFRDGSLFTCVEVEGKDKREWKVARTPAPGSVVEMKDMGYLVS
jgi:hypothetical protein